MIVARPGDLVPFFDNTVISDDSDQAAGNLDGLGFSYSAQALTAAGLAPSAAVTSGGVQYDWPAVAAGRPDNVAAAGQTIAVPPVAGASELGVPGSATNGPSSGTMTITYTDGTSQTAPLDSPTGPPPASRSTTGSSRRCRTATARAAHRSRSGRRCTARASRSRRARRSPQ